MKIFLDANILFSGAKSNGAIRRLLASLVQEQHELWADALVIEEARRNLSLKYPGTISNLDGLLTQVRLATIPGDLALPTALHSLLPEKDQPVLAAAIRVQCDVLLTGDRTHFGELFGRRFESVAVHSPTSLAKTLSGARRR